MQRSSRYAARDTGGRVGGRGRGVVPVHGPHASELRCLPCRARHRNEDTRMNFADVYTTDSALITLYQLLQERTPEQSISHKEMPSWDEHVAYIAKRPVPHWYLIEAGGPWVGSIYLSRR